VDHSDNQSQPILTVLGENVAIGPGRSDLVGLYQRWFNDIDVMTFYTDGPITPSTYETSRAQYDRVTNDETDIRFTVYERDTLRPIGLSDLFQIDYFNRTAGFGVLIGEKDCWGRGYGTEITRLMLDYAFTVLGLHSVRLAVFSYNERARRVYERAGFRVIGRWREAKRLGGRPFDIIYMDCIATEVQSPVLHRIVPDKQPHPTQIDIVDETKL
jgi:diamine N-acetyltransferase